MFGLFALFNLISIPLILKDSMRGYRLAGHRYTAKQFVNDISQPFAYFLWTLFYYVNIAPAGWSPIPKAAESWIMLIALPFMIVAVIVQVRRARETRDHVEKRSGIDFNRY